MTRRAVRAVAPYDGIAHSSAGTLFVYPTDVAAVLAAPPVTVEPAVRIRAGHQAQGAPIRRAARRPDRIEPGERRQSDQADRQVEDKPTPVRHHEVELGRADEGERFR